MSSTRTAVVTGTSTGFGFETAKHLAASGYTVFATMRDVAKRNRDGANALEALGIRVVEIDLTDDVSVERGAAAILAQAPHVDVVINNAGAAYFGTAEAFTPAALERQFAINVTAPLRVSRAFLPGMRERGSGLLVFVSSVVGRFVLPFGGIYTASKWAVEALAESLSYEVRPFGVDVAIVQPGAYATNIGSASVGPDDAARVASYGDVAKTIDQIAAGLAASARNPVEVAEAIVVLANAPAHTRPLRTVVPPGAASEAINAATEPIQRAILESFGLGAFLTKAPATT